MRKNNSISISDKDKLLMQLTHYFIMQENYTPMVVNGANGEIWLENLDANYRIIRINLNYIHNNEQLDFDLFKIKHIVKQVKRKTLSFKIKTLNILLNIGSNVDINGHQDKSIDNVVINVDSDDINNNALKEIYPEIDNYIVDSDDTFNLIMNLTDDINRKANDDNMEYEKIFSPKSISVTHLFIALNIIVFIVSYIGTMNNSFDLLTLFALRRSNVQSGEIHRLLTAIFTHQSIIHLGMNMYALYVIGSQVETYIGKFRYALIYILSGITGCLLSCVVNTGWSIGASGAIFGLMGSLLYFGYHYRLYLDSVLKSQIIPLILVNLCLGFIIPGIDVAGHIGGLVGGFFVSMAVGVDKKGAKSDRINGCICSIILIVFLSILIFM